MCAFYCDGPKYCPQTIVKSFVVSFGVLGVSGGGGVGGERGERERCTKKQHKYDVLDSGCAALCFCTPPLH